MTPRDTVQEVFDAMTPGIPASAPFYPHQGAAAMTDQTPEDQQDDVDLAPMEITLLPRGDVMSMLLGTEPFMLVTLTMEDGAVTPRVVTGGGFPQTAEGVTEAVDLLHGYLHQGAVTEVEAQP